MGKRYNPNRDKDGQFAAGVGTPPPTASDFQYTACQSDDPAVCMWQDTMQAYRKAVAEKQPRREPFKRTNYSGYLLDNRDEALTLLARQGVVPQHDRVVFEHVTYQYPDKETAPALQSLSVVGHQCVDGVQAVVVSVDGTHTRSDGSFYHITVSLADGHKPVESNSMLLNNGFIPLETPVLLNVTAF